MSAVLIDDDFIRDPDVELARDLCLDADHLARNDPKTRSGALNFAELAAVHLDSARGIVDALSAAVGGDTGGARLTHALEIMLSLVHRHLSIAIDGLLKGKDRAAPVADQPPASA